MSQALLPTARREAHTVHGASNFAAFVKGPPLVPLAVPLASLQPQDGDTRRRRPSIEHDVETARRVFFVRHCEGEHNAAKEAGSTSAYLLKDAVLTAKGERNATEILQASSFCIDGQPSLPELVVMSPMRRTMQTAQLAFGGINVPCILRPELQEVGLTPCDRASPALGEEMLVR
jgi:hypothetical protein